MTKAKNTLFQRCIWRRQD